jgi:hypothetical protein
MGICMISRVCDAFQRRWAILLGLMAITGPAAAQTASSPSAAGAPLAVIAGALRPTAAPTFSATAAPDQDLVSVPVAYIFTGVLRKEVRPVLSFGFSANSRPIPAGTPVFGLPSSGPSWIEPHPLLLWCALRTEDAAPDGPARWAVTCFPKLFKTSNPRAFLWVPLGEDLVPAKFGVSMRSDHATPPDIEEKPVALDLPISVAIQFAGWDNNQANLRVIVRQPVHNVFSPLSPTPPARPTEVLARMHLPRDASGAAHLPLFGGEILIRPGPDGKSAAAELARPFSTGAR